MKISVITPCYNAEQYINECVLSVLNQTYTNFELICVDDCSTDSTLDILKSYSAKDDRVKVFQMETNSGSAKCPTDLGLSKATGEFTCTLANDDILDKDYLQQMVARQIESKSDIVCSKMIFFNDESSNFWELPEPHFDFSQVISGKEAVMLTVVKWLIGFNGALVRREIMLSKSSYMDNTIHQMNADEFDTRELLILADKVAFSEAMYHYRNHENSITKKLTPKLYEVITTDRMIARLFERKFGKGSAEYNLTLKIWISSFRKNWNNYIENSGKFDEKSRNQIESYFLSEYSCVGFTELWSSTISFKTKVMFSSPFLIFKCINKFF